MMKGIKRPFLSEEASSGASNQAVRPLCGIVLKMTAAAALLLSGSIGAPEAALAAAPAIPAAQAAVPKLDTIRVALFIDTGKYVSRASAVTLSADAGLTLSLRGAAGVTPAYQAAAKEQVRVSADGYYALLPETASAAEARTQAQQAAAGVADAGIVQNTARGKQAYRVYLGPFATKEEAAAAAAARPGAVLAGPLRWNAGTYAAAAEAQAQAAAIAQAGFDANVAQLSAGSYAVLVGGAADNAGLEALRAQIAAALPAVVLTPMDAAQGYVLLRTELAADADSAAQPLTAMIFGGNAKLWAASNDPQGAVYVKERFGRMYRGGLELSLHNHRLAVINELSFQQYLYAVLGSELNPAWPIEALKAQAVAARTYALKQGVKYQIAHVSDTTLDQSYKGMAVEFPAALQAVDSTAGEVLTYNNALIDPLYYSNAGGQTADSTEVWGNEVAYLKSVSSQDKGAEEGKKKWYRIVLPNGMSGYIHSDYARDTGLKNPAGLPYYESVQDGVNVRPAPYVDNAGNAAVFKVDVRDRFVVIGEETESNAYAWIRGPYEASEMKKRLGSAMTAGGELQRLEVTKRGVSGRALEVAANGQPLAAAYPDALRTLLGGLPSTKFEIEETGRYNILGADGTVRTQSSSAQPVYTSGGGQTVQEHRDEELFLLNADGTVRVATRSPQFVFRGTGFGHGLGMSQWGAKGYAELGYDYHKILQTYYIGVSISKG
ncbi:SpoIID/LytB domain-containing protein [Paenibacillus naphthalenovorans]|uniref:SpoIID/LytB domain-containing protein n=1 Tax=Paenibacillus naphthalenovorans TaxID=162209 RepID=UPI003D2B985D